MEGEMYGRRKVGKGKIGGKEEDREAFKGKVGKEKGRYVREEGSQGRVGEVRGGQGKLNKGRKVR